MERVSVFAKQEHCIEAMETLERSTEKIEHARQD
jgi:hypothetical protein